MRLPVHAQAYRRVETFNNLNAKNEVDHLENCSHLTYPAVCPLNETSTVDVQQ
jgi:hypothetical protein